jgi:hypothetical protein
MPQKTYVPGANDKARQLDKYLSRYEEVLSQGKTADQLTALANLISCLATFIQQWPKPTPEN